MSAAAACLIDGVDMRQTTGTIEINTARQGLVEITAAVAAWVAEQRYRAGLLTLSVGTHRRRS